MNVNSQWSIRVAWVLLVLASFVLNVSAVLAAEGDEDGEGDGGDDPDDDGDTDEDGGVWKRSKPSEDDTEWKKIQARTSYDPLMLFPHQLSGRLGFHMFPAMTLSKGKGVKSGEVPGKEQFEHVLFDDFQPEMLAGVLFEIAYGYRAHRNFQIQSSFGYFGQNLSKDTEVGDFEAKTTYRYLGLVLNVGPQARIPVSKVDFFVGLYVQALWYQMSFAIRGAVEEEIPGSDEVDVDGYRLKYEDTGILAGGSIEGGFEYRPSGNFGVALRYRYSMVPGTFEGESFDHGGHHGMLSSEFHF